MPSLLLTISNKTKVESILKFSNNLAKILDYDLVTTTYSDKDLLLKQSLKNLIPTARGSKKDFFFTLDNIVRDPSLEISLVLISQHIIDPFKRYKATNFFARLRGLRIPYLILPEKLPPHWCPENIVFPVCSKDGEKEASAWAGFWGRSGKSNVLLLHPEFRNKDYRQKLLTTIAFIQQLFKKSNTIFEIKKAGTTSKETRTFALEKAKALSNSLLIVPATRLNSPEYVFTGPPELKLLKNRGNTPVLFVNPRHDLYIPCN
jgi:hypothetical protein